MNTEKPEYTKPAWAPECPWKEGNINDGDRVITLRAGWLAAEAAIYAALWKSKCDPVLEKIQAIGTAGRDYPPPRSARKESALWRHAKATAANPPTP